MNNYSAHIMCSNQVKKCVYPVGGDIKRRKKEGVFLGGAYFNGPPPLQLWCVLPGTANMIFVFLVLCRPLKIKEKIIK